MLFRRRYRQEVWGQFEAEPIGMIFNGLARSIRNAIDNHRTANPEARNIYMAKASALIEYAITPRSLREFYNLFPSIKDIIDPTKFAVG